MPRCVSYIDWRLAFVLKLRHPINYSLLGEILIDTVHTCVDYNWKICIEPNHPLYTETLIVTIQEYLQSLEGKANQDWIVSQSTASAYAQFSVFAPSQPFSKLSFLDSYKGIFGDITPKNSKIEPIPIPKNSPGFFSWSFPCPRLIADQPSINRRLTAS